MNKKWDVSAARRASFARDAKIVPGPAAPEFKNPKRGKSAARFATYKKHKTVGDYEKAWGTLGMIDICWDLSHGFIVLENTK